MEIRIPVSCFTTKHLRLRTPVFICTTQDGLGTILTYGLVARRGESYDTVGLDNGDEYDWKNNRFKGKPAWMFVADPDIVRTLIDRLNESERTVGANERRMQASSETLRRVAQDLTTSCQQPAPVPVFSFDFAPRRAI